jgi:excisionase family DNA binding protein
MMDSMTLTASDMGRPQAAALGGVSNLETRQDVARYLPVSTRTVDRLRESGALPYRRIGGQVRFLPLDVAAYVEGSRGSAVC